MRVTKHDESLIMITKLGFINCFLVIEDDGVTLVDALTHGSGQEILEAISQTGKPLKRVLMTHAHSDHIGSLDEVVAVAPDVDLLVQERGVPILAGDVSEPSRETGRAPTVAHSRRLSRRHCDR